MKLPPEAKKVFNGIIFDVYQWRQPMYDGSIATFEGLKRTNTIEIIATDGHTIWLADEEQPVRGQALTLFGGRQEEGEDPLICAKRELLEEAGMESDDWQLYATYMSPGKIEWTTYLYIARNCRKIAESNLDPGEKIEMKSVSFDELIDLIASGQLYTDKDLTIDVLRMKLDSEKLAAFRAQIFGGATQ